VTVPCPTCGRQVTPNSRGRRSHTNKRGRLCPTAQIIGYYVMIEFNTDSDGRWVEVDDLPEDQVPKCIFGPFATERDAWDWMENDYPQDDTDVYDMYSFRPDDPRALGYVNSPDIHRAG
jgi:hypothetical protein